MQERSLKPISESLTSLNEEFTAVLDKEIADYTGGLLGLIGEKWKDRYAEIDRIVLAGGGANLIERFLPEDNFYEVPKDPQYANARGWCLMAKEELEQEG